MTARTHTLNAWLKDLKEMIGRVLVGAGIATIITSLFFLEAAVIAFFLFGLGLMMVSGGAVLAGADGE